MTNKKRINNIYKIAKTKKFNEKLGYTLFLTRVSGLVFKSRKEEGLSQQKLAKKADTTQRIISEIENGGYNMGSDVLYRIFKALDKKLLCDDKDLISGANVYSNIHIVTIGASASKNGTTEDKNKILKFSNATLTN
jgi:transcriptional regulator with XRE-family HTH domain